MRVYGYIWRDRERNWGVECGFGDDSGNGVGLAVHEFYNLGSQRLRISCLWVHCCFESVTMMLILLRSFFARRHQGSLKCWHFFFFRKLENLVSFYYTVSNSHSINKWMALNNHEWSCQTKKFLSTFQDVDGQSPGLPHAHHKGKKIEYRWLVKEKCLILKGF